MMYRCKPVEVEAWQLFPDSYQVIMQWLRVHEVPLFDHGWEGSRRFITIDTPEGHIKACQGDWIIRNSFGQFLPCKPHVFSSMYESTDLMNSTARHCMELVDSQYLKGDLSERASAFRQARNAILKHYGE